MNEAEAKARADELVDGFPYDVPEGQPRIITQCGGMDLMRDRIAAALLAASRPPEGHIRTDEGKDLRVLGTLPVNPEGIVIGDNARVWCVPPWEVSKPVECNTGVLHDLARYRPQNRNSQEVETMTWAHQSVSRLHSTPEAASAAKGVGDEKGGQ